MPAHRKGPHLWLRRARLGADGTRRRAVWLIRDGDYRASTGCARHDLAHAEAKLEAYIADKHARTAASAGSRHPAAIAVADVLTLYARDVAPRHADPAETARRIEVLGAYFTGTLADVSGATCRAFAASLSEAAARRALEDLRAAINHHRREGLCSEIIAVWLPPRGPARERWLTRAEAARMIRAAWRYREQQLGEQTARFPRRHIARLILIGLYTGSRRAVICAAALNAKDGFAAGGGHIDCTRGVFYRKPAGRRDSKKRAPPVPLPQRLLAHLRRWKKNGQRFAVEYNGAPIAEPRKAFAAVVKAAGLDPDVTPHTLRHTAATWLMQAGCEMWVAAGFLGMTVEMLSRRYGHHHPQHLQGARDAFARHRDAVAERVARRA